MKRILLCIGIQLALTVPLIADSNLRIIDVGLGGYPGTPTAVRLFVRNPSPQTQAIHLRVAASGSYGTTANTVESEVRLNGGEERELELPILLTLGQGDITAEAGFAGTVFGHDMHKGARFQSYLIALMCASENVCKSAQSQIQFSGTIEDRVDKNRQMSFEVVRDPRDHWWAYSAARTVVLGMPTSEFTPAQRDALEGFLRRGGCLILLEKEIADPSFLSTYRQGVPPRDGERVGKGWLIRVSDLGANTLGDAFSGQSLPIVLAQSQRFPANMNETRGFISRFATAFNFPRLRSVLIWLLAYIIIIGVLNFAVLRRLHRLEFGWISTCALAFLFAGGFYFSSARQRPKDFQLDNLATYYLDAQSPLAAADYELRVSAPERRNILFSVADPAVFTYFATNAEEANSQIWSEINDQGVRFSREFDFRFGLPSETELSLLKWSFRDLNMAGLREFPGTVHLVGPNRLRNDTGQRFSEAVYVNWAERSAYALQDLAPGQEIQLDAITPTKIRTQGQTGMAAGENQDPRTMTLQQIAVSGAFAFDREGNLFVGFSDGPALPVELSVSYRQSVHSLIVVAVAKP